MPSNPKSLQVRRGLASHLCRTTTCVVQANEGNGPRCAPRRNLRILPIQAYPRTLCGSLMGPASSIDSSQRVREQRERSPSRVQTFGVRIKLNPGTTCHRKAKENREPGAGLVLWWGVGLSHCGFTRVFAPLYLQRAPPGSRSPVVSSCCAADLINLLLAPTAAPITSRRLSSNAHHVDISMLPWRDGSIFSLGPHAATLCWGT